MRAFVIFTAISLALVPVRIAGAEGDQPAPIVINFQPAEAELDERATNALDKAAAWLKTNPDAIVVIEAHKESMSYLDDDRDLLAARAREIRDYLIGAKVQGDRIRLPFDESVEGDAELQRYVVRLTTSEDARDATTKKKKQRKLDGSLAPEPTAVTEYIYVETAVVEPVPLPLSYALSAGGGVLNSIDGGTTELGGTWNVRLTAGTRHTLGAEIGYVGIAQPIDEAMGLGSSAMLVGNGAEGAVRVALSRTALQPYGFAGAGLMHFDVLDASAGVPGDLVALFPAGLGLSYRGDWIFLDLRGTARAAFDDEMFEEMDGGGLDSWSVSLQVGAEL